MRWGGLFVGIFIILAAANAHAFTIELETGFSGTQSQTISGVTLGTKFSFELKALAVDTIPMPPPCDNLPGICNIQAPPSGTITGIADVPGPVAPGLQVATNAPLFFWPDWTLFEFDTSANAGEIVDLLFGASTSGNEFENWHIAFRNIAIDGKQLELAAVPEPQSGWLFAGPGGLALLALWRRKRHSFSVRTA